MARREKAKITTIYKYSISFFDPKEIKVEKITDVKEYKTFYLTLDNYRIAKDFLEKLLGYSEMFSLSNDKVKYYKNLLIAKEKRTIEVANNFIELIKKMPIICREET